MDKQLLLIGMLNKFKISLTDLVSKAIGQTMPKLIPFVELVCLKSWVAAEAFIPIMT